MSQATNTKLMDTERGGEQTQYEGVNTFSKEPAREGGVFGDSNPSSSSALTSDPQAEAQKAERGEKTAENIRYGEAISEHGFGGETVGNGGKANQGRFGEIEDQSLEGQRARREDKNGNGGDGFGEIEDMSLEGQKARREMGYGGGSGVGA